MVVANCCRCSCDVGEKVDCFCLRRRLILPGLEELTDPAIEPTFRDAVRICMEFAFYGVVQVSGRTKKIWSQLRPCVQEMVRKCAARKKAVLPGGNVTDIFRSMQAELSLAETEAGGPAEQNLKSRFMNSAAAKIVQKWIEMNNAADVTAQPCFQAALSAILAEVCVCRRGNNNCPAHDLGTLSLADLLYLIADAVHQHVPAAVPGFAVGLILCFAEKEATNADGLRAEQFPSCGQFLCHGEEVIETPDASDPDTTTRVTLYKPKNESLKKLVALRGLYICNLIKSLMHLLQLPQEGAQPAGKSKVAKAKKTCFVDCQVQDLQQAADALLATTTEDGDGGNTLCQEVVGKLETLLAASASSAEDEVDTLWCSSWAKLIAMTIRDGVPPTKLEALALDLPDEFKYMIKHEISDGWEPADLEDPRRAIAAAAAGQGAEGVPDSGVADCSAMVSRGRSLHCVNGYGPYRPTPLNVNLMI